jgi:Flp pilus assembly protein TadB
VAVLAGVAAVAVTGWPVAAVVAAGGAWVLPGLVGPDRVARTQVERIEAVAAWTEMLRDTLAAAAGLEQAIIATAPGAPAAIRPQVQALAADLTGHVTGDHQNRAGVGGRRLPDALRAFADGVADPTGDLVVAALVMASAHQGRQLTELLASLATAAREQAAMRLRVEAGRARTRTSVRVIIITTVVMAAGLIALNRPYLTPYDTAAGQLVLAAITVVFALALTGLARIARAGTLARVLAPPASLAAAGPPRAATDFGAGR